MFKQSYIVLILSTLFAFSSYASDSNHKMKKAMPKANAFKVDTKKSKVVWYGAKVASSHNGMLKIKKGNLDFKGNDLVGGTFVFDMNSISVTDIENPKYNKKLVGHLKSDDFFSTTKHKTATLKITDTQFGKGGVWNVTGDLTIKGITKPVSFDANVTKSKKGVVAKANIVFNRLTYKIKYNSGSFFKNLGDKLIKDNVRVNVDLVGTL